MTQAGIGYVYLIHGENTFDRDVMVGQLKQRMRNLPAGEHNLTELVGAEATVANLRLAADAVPFLADKRMVVVYGLIGRLQGQGKGSGARKRGRGKSGGDAANAATAAEYEALLAYLPQVPETTSIVFVEGGGIQAEPIKAAMPEKRDVVRPHGKVDDVPRWIRDHAREVGVELDAGAVRDLTQLGGDDLWRLDAELRKLAAYVDGGVVSREDVQELVVGRDLLSWALLNALADRQRERALSAFRQLLNQGETAEALLARDVIPQYRRLLAAKEVAGLDRRARTAVDVNALGLNPRMLPRYMEQAARFDRDELERALELLLGLDRAVKNGDTDTETGLELALVELCSRLSVSGARG